MEQIYEIGLLLDFYGQLLTDRQFEILDLHYNNDYSLGEIAEQLNISRQGVFDNVKRGKAILNEMEEKLGLVRKFAEHKKKAEQLLDYIKSVDKGSLLEKDARVLDLVEEGIIDIINRI